MPLPVPESRIERLTRILLRSNSSEEEIVKPVAPAGSIAT